ncbi:MAG: HyaD/HybD family hydrogenase maturation endopeptidase [Nitrospinae bacterium]|nr:HyaD/HybD family hydrogenase maturation endopeptidase [Nitrospinota bacterium]
MTMPTISVLGIGNILLQDDGAGVRAVERLQREYTFPDNVRLIDVGTTVYHNMGILAESEKLLVLDAVKLDGPPGTVYRFSADEFRVKLPRKATSHDVGILNALSMMALTGQTPPEAVIIGIQPKEYGRWGESLSHEVEKGLDEMINEALRQLEAWEVSPVQNSEISHLKNHF